MDYFEDAVSFVLYEEIGPSFLKGGTGLTNNPNDPGGITQFGISQKYHPKVNVKALTLEKAKAIYKKDYWKPMNGDKFTDYGLALVMFDSMVNPGPGKAVKWMQEAINCLSLVLYKEVIKVDGKFGPKSVEMMNRLVEDNYGDALKVMFIGIKAVYHMREVLVDPSDKPFFAGWMRRLARVTKEAF